MVGQSQGTSSLAAGSAQSRLRRTGVVACIEKAAAPAGARILELGGNATDAAIATAFAQGVVDPIYCGIGGGLHGVFFDAVQRRAVAVSAGGRAPLGVKVDGWRFTGAQGALWQVEGLKNRLGYQASMVPGFVRGAAEAFQRCGSGAVSWRQVIEPAIELAEDGFLVYPYLYRLWMDGEDRQRSFIETGDGARILRTTAEARRLYLHPDGRVYEVGDPLIQPDLARTLQRIADEGPDEFYIGETGQRIAADFAANGGFLSQADLQTFRADVMEPIGTTVGDYEVLTESSPTVGPVTLQLLNILEGWDLGGMGWNTPRYLDRLARAMHVAFRDRLTLLGDPEFVDVPIQRIISKEYAAELRDSIDKGTESQDRIDSARQPMKGDTTHVTAVDGDGNGAAITHSVGLSSGVATPGLGFLHNSHMMMFDPRPGSRNEVRPWKRPITGGGPVLFLRGGELALMIGSPGGARKVSAIVQAFLNATTFGMSLDQAVHADRIHAEMEADTVVVEPYFPRDALLGLARFGQHIRFDWYCGRLAGVARDPDGGLHGASDYRGDGGLVVVE